MPKVLTTSAVLISLLLFNNHQALSQNDKTIITFAKGKFTFPDELPYGQVILVIGESDSDIKSIEINCIVLNETKTYKAEKASSKKWSATIGPFPLRSKVIISVKENRKISLSEQNVIIDSLKKFIEKLKIMGSFDNNQLKEGLDSTFRAFDYSNNVGESIGSILIEKINPVLISKLNNETKLLKTNLIRAINEVSDSELASALKQNTSKALSSLSSPTDSLLALIASTIKKDTSIARSLTSEYKKIYDKYHDGVEEFRNLTSDLFAILVTPASFSTSFDVSGIQAYVGVDLGAIKFDTVTSFFVTFYPYFRRTDPDKDYDWTRKNFFHKVTPAFGLGIGKDIDQLKPIYFVGLGVRINKVFRVAAGGAYFKPKETNNEKWNFGFSASVNINYVADLLRLITAAQSQVK